ncbi:MAG: hypothetical protein JSS70_05075 [Bacteroidetes bacterium]|nr:hypothetical protein [Bacteroidota bacterium]
MGTLRKQRTRMGIGEFTIGARELSPKLKIESTTITMNLYNKKPFKEI